MSIKEFKMAKKTLIKWNIALAFENTEKARKSNEVGMIINTH